jgi:hypothetical protein
MYNLCFDLGQPATTTIRTIVNKRKKQDELEEKGLKIVTAFVVWELGFVL